MHMYIDVDVCIGPYKSAENGVARRAVPWDVDGETWRCCSQAYRSSSKYLLAHATVASSDGFEGLLRF